MVDISLSYSDIWTTPGSAFKISLWLDNELPRDIHSSTDFTFRVEYFDVAGVAVAPAVQSTHQLVLRGSANLRVSDFAPPVINNNQPEGSVLIVRTTLVNKTDGSLMVSHDYTFAVAKTRPVAPFASLLSAPTTNLAVATSTNNTVVVSNARDSVVCAIFVKVTLQFKNGTDVPYAIFDRNHFWLKVSCMRKL
eukprot:COSAG02_NODE_4347_length_5471_cov_2.563477_4_plen_193_part_00